MKKIMFTFFLLTFLWGGCSNRNKPSREEGEKGLGLVWNDEAYEALPRKPVLVRSLYRNLKSAHSLAPYCPAVGNQGNYGTCVGWASAYYARTILYAMAKGTTDLNQITEEAFSPGFLYRYIAPNDQECDDGSRLDHAAATLQKIGVPFKSDFDVDCPTSIPSDVESKAANFRIENYTRLFDFDSDDFNKVELVKKSLSENFPVIIGMALGIGHLGGVRYLSLSPIAIHVQSLRNL